MFKKTLFLTCTTAMLSANSGLCADVPKYRDFPADMHTGYVAQLDLRDGKIERYRTDLEAAHAGGVNFAGRYVLATWPAGSNCTSGATIDAETGKVQLLPFAACFWKGEYTNPFEFKSDSTLLVVAGQVGEEGESGVHFFEFDQGNFKPANEGSFSAPVFGSRAAFIEPSAGPSEEVESSQARPSKDELWKNNWEIANKRPFDFLLLCYSATADVLKEKLATGLGEKFEAHFVTAGGNTENAELAISLCDRDIRKIGYFNDEQSYRDASTVFRMIAATQDMKMLAYCQSEQCKEIAKIVFANGEVR